MDVSEAEALAAQIESDVQQEMNTLRQDRNVSLSIYFFYGFFLTTFTTTFCVLLFLYKDNWERGCDLGTKIWTLVWLSRMIVQLVCNIMVTASRMHGVFRTRDNVHRVPRWLSLLTRFIHAFGFSWWILGIDQIFFEPSCPEQTFSRTVAQIMFWLTATVYLVPFVLYTLFCLCLPCIFYFMAHVAVRPADRQPTPLSLVQQLEMKTYKDLLESFRREYTIDNHEVSIQQERRRLPGLSLETVIDGVSSLLNTTGATAAATSSESSSSTVVPAGGSAATGSGIDSPSRHSDFGAVSSRSNSATCFAFPAASGATASGPSSASLLSQQVISINRACPICMADLNDDDQLLVMPCDHRHFFHKTCLEHWLETSQACPICRANIVNLLTGTPSDPTANPVDHRDLEMQI